MLSDLLYKSESLFQVRINDEFYSVANPKIKSFIVVLNNSAVKILNDFATPRNFSTVCRKYSSQISTHRLQNLINDFQKAGLLLKNTPAGKEILIPQKSKQISAWLHTTNKCNLRCKYCYINKTEDDMPWSIAKTSVDKVYDEAKKKKLKGVKFKLAGGEPTLRPSFLIKLFTYIRRKEDQEGIRTRIVLLSNGVSINDELLKNIAEKKVEVMISLDGIGKWNDSQRIFADGTGSFVFIEKTLKKLQRHEIDPTISITVSEKNADGIEAIFTYLLKRKLYKIGLSFYRENPCSKNTMQNNLNIEKLITGMKKGYKVFEKFLPNYNFSSSLLDLVSFHAPHQYTCEAGRNYFAVDTKGKIYKCQMDFENPVTDIYADNVLNDVRKSKAGLRNIPVDEKLECSSCKFKYWCTGGCPLLAYRTNNSNFGKSPYCKLYKTLIPEIIRLEGLRILKYQ